MTARSTSRAAGSTAARSTSGPRPYQQPHPPIWVTIGSAGSAVPVAQRQHIGAVFLAGYPRIREIFDGYRNTYQDAHGTDAPLDRLAYCALVYVGHNEKEARDGGRKGSLVHDLEQGPAALEQPAGLPSAGGRRPDHEGRARRRGHSAGAQAGRADGARQRLRGHGRTRSSSRSRHSGSTRAGSATC